MVLRYNTGHIMDPTPGVTPTLYLLVKEGMSFQRSIS